MSESRWMWSFSQDRSPGVSRASSTGADRSSFPLCTIAEVGMILFVKEPCNPDTVNSAKMMRHSVVRTGFSEGGCGSPVATQSGRH